MIFLLTYTPYFSKRLIHSNIYEYDVKLMRARVLGLSFFVVVAGKTQLLYSLETSFPPHDCRGRADGKNERVSEREKEKERRTMRGGE